MATPAPDNDMRLFSFYNARTQEQRVSQRITGQEIAALKQAQKRTQSATNSLVAMLASLVRNFFNTAGSLLYVSAKKHAMCENYGHIADPSTWTDHLPKCMDCGAKISNRSQLRSSVPTK